MLNSVSESVSWGPQFGSLEDRDYIRAFGCFPIGNKGKLRLFEHRSNMLKQSIRTFNQACIWITQGRAWSNHYERANEAGVNRY